MVMKNILLLLLFTVLFSTCKKDQDFLFTMDYDLEFTIQPGLNPFGGIYGYKIKNIPSNYSSYLTTNGLTDADVLRIAPAGAKVSALLSGSGYGFIRNATVFLASPTDTAFFKPVFERFQVPENTGLQLEMIGTLVDAGDLLREETFEVWFEMELRDFSPELITSRLELEFHAQGE